MFKLKPFLAIALALCIFVSCKSKPSDTQIQDSVAKQLQENNSYAGVKSTVKGGVVTLTGMCAGDNCATDIENNVSKLDGVKKVENNIVKDASTDLTLRTSVQNILVRYPGVQADVAQGVIVLRGNINRGNLQNLMSDLSALHPQKIDNQLVVN